LSQYPPGVQFIFEGFEGGKARFRAVYPEGVYETVYMDPVFSAQTVYADSGAAATAYLDRVFGYSEPEVLYASEPKYIPLEAVLRPQSVSEVLEASAGRDIVATAVDTVTEYVAEPRAVLSLTAELRPQTVYESVDVEAGKPAYTAVAAAVEAVEHTSETFVAKGTPEMLRGPPTPQQILQDLDSRLDRVLEALGGIAAPELIGAVTGLRVTITGLKTQIRILLSSPSIDSQAVARLNEQVPKVEAAAELLKKTQSLLQQLESAKSSIPADKYSDLKKRIIDAASKISQLDPSGAQLLSQIESEIQSLLQSVQQVQTQQAVSTAAAAGAQLVKQVLGVDVDQLYDQILKGKAALVVTAKVYSRENYGMLSQLFDTALSVVNKVKQGQDPSPNDLLVLLAAQQWSQKVLDNVKAIADWWGPRSYFGYLPNSAERAYNYLMRRVDEAYEKLKRGESVTYDISTEIKWGLDQISSTINAGIVQLSRQASSWLLSKATEVEKDNPALAWLLRGLSYAATAAGVAGQYAALAYLNALTGGAMTPVITVTATYAGLSQLNEVMMDPVTREQMNRFLEAVKSDPRAAAELGATIAAIIAGIALARQLQTSGLIEKAAAVTRNEVANGILKIAQIAEQKGYTDLAAKLRAAALKVSPPAPITEYKGLEIPTKKEFRITYDPRTGNYYLEVYEAGQLKVTKTIGGETLRNIALKLTQAGATETERDLVQIFNTWANSKNVPETYLRGLIDFLERYADPKTAKKIVDALRSGAEVSEVTAIVKTAQPTIGVGSRLIVEAGGKQYEFTLLQVIGEKGETKFVLEAPPEVLEELRNIKAATPAEALYKWLQQKGLSPADFMRIRDVFGRSIEDLLREASKTAEAALRPSIEIFLPEGVRLSVDPVKGVIRTVAVNTDKTIASVTRVLNLVSTKEGESITTELIHRITIEKGLFGSVKNAAYEILSRIRLPSTPKLMEILSRYAGPVSASDIDALISEIGGLTELPSSTRQALVQTLQDVKKALMSMGGRNVVILVPTAETDALGAASITLSVAAVGTAESIIRAAAERDPQTAVQAAKALNLETVFTPRTVAQEVVQTVSRDAAVSSAVAETIQTAESRTVSLIPEVKTKAAYVEAQLTREVPIVSTAAVSELQQISETSSAQLRPDYTYRTVYTEELKTVTRDLPVSSSIPETASESVSSLIRLEPVTTSRTIYEEAVKTVQSDQVSGSAVPEPSFEPEYRYVSLRPEFMHRSIYQEEVKTVEREEKLSGAVPEREQTSEEHRTGLEPDYVHRSVFDEVVRTLETESRNTVFVPVTPIFAGESPITNLEPVFNTRFEYEPVDHTEVFNQPSSSITPEIEYSTETAYGQAQAVVQIEVVPIYYRIDEYVPGGVPGPIPVPPGVPTLPGGEIRALQRPRRVREVEEVVVI